MVTGVVSGWATQARSDRVGRGVGRGILRRIVDRVGGARVNGCRGTGSHHRCRRADRRSGRRGRGLRLVGRDDRFQDRAEQRRRGHRGSGSGHRGRGAVRPRGRLLCSHRGSRRAACVLRRSASGMTSTHSRCTVAGMDAGRSRSSTRPSCTVARIRASRAASGRPAASAVCTSARASLTSLSDCTDSSRSDHSTLASPHRVSPGRAVRDPTAAEPMSSAQMATAMNIAGRAVFRCRCRPAATVWVAGRTAGTGGSGVEEISSRQMSKSSISGSPPLAPGRTGARRAGPRRSASAVSLDQQGVDESVIRENVCDIDNRGIAVSAL